MMWKIVFMGNSNVLKENAHRCRQEFCTTLLEIEMNSREEALDFWWECTYPITTLDSIIPPEPQFEALKEYINENRPVTEVELLDVQSC